MKKKILAIILAAVSLALASCTGISEQSTTSLAAVTTQGFETMGTTTVLLPETPAYPADQTPVRCALVHQNNDGVSMELTLIGYGSESLGKSFYFTDGVMHAEVKITNNSGKTIYQTIPSYCHGNGHNHEISVSLADSEGKMLRNMNIGVCPAMLQSWSLDTGESITFTLSFAAGDYVTIGEEESADIKLTTQTHVTGIKLYENYEDGACKYTGSISFGYGYGANNTSPSNPEAVFITAEAEFLKF